MAIPTAAHLNTAAILQQIKDIARRPATDAEMGGSDDMWYRFMTEAQRYWTQRIVTVAKRPNAGDVLQLVLSNGLYHFWDFYRSTFASPTLITPMWFGAVSRTSERGYPLYVTDPHERGDLTYVGASGTVSTGHLRAISPGTSSATLFSRWIVPSGTVDATPDGELTLMPEDARELIVWRTLELWAKRGGGKGRDPRIYENEQDNLWTGSRPGDYGLLGYLQTQYPELGNEFSDGYWWHSPDLGTHGV